MLEDCINCVEDINKTMSFKSNKKVTLRIVFKDLQTQTHY